MRRDTLSTVILSLSLGASLPHAVGDEITFAEDVAPIIYNHCVVCHREKGIGPFRLDSYESTQRRSRQISEVVSSRFMPPWKPDPNFGPKFQGERRLSEEQIQTIIEWHNSGAPPGDLDQAPAIPKFPDTWERGEPDAILEFPEPYILQAEGTDIYRNFVIPVPFDSTKFIRAIEFLPESQNVIHHAVLQVDKTTTSRTNDEMEPGPGFDGMGIGAAAPPEGQLVGWTPGQRPYESYPGTAWTLEPESDIVIQLHMLPTGKTESISPRIGLYFTDDAPTRTSFVLQMKDFDIDIAPGEADYTIEESMEVPVDIDIIGVYPHAHYIGKDLGAYALFPDGSKQWLFRIPDWDFNWQSDYRYVEPLRIPAGSTLHMSYTYDNSAANIRNPSSPPLRVVGGWNSYDEMAELSIQVLPVHEKDLVALRKAQAKYEIESAGGKARYAYNLGNYFELQGLLSRAGNYYFDAVQEDPAFASAHFKLGHVLERMGNLAGAEDRYRTALALRPELIPANIGLARVHYQNRAEFLAIDLLEQVLSWEPQNYDARVYLARIQQGYSSPEKAKQILEAGVAFHQSNPYYQLELGKLDHVTGNAESALEHFLFAAENEPDLSKPLSKKESNSLKSEAYRSIAEIYVGKGETAKAEEHLETAIELMPHNIAALLDSAKIAFEAGDVANSSARLRQISALPENVRPNREYIRNAIPSADWRKLVNDAYPD